MTIPAVILAGGRSRRMRGDDKSHALLSGKPLIAHVMCRLRQQAHPIAICAAENSSRFGSWNVPVLEDAIEGGQGPLVGLLAGMDWAVSNTPTAEFLVSVPVDVPFLPLDFVETLVKKQIETNTDIVVATSNNHVHFAAALWSLSVIRDLHHILTNTKIRRVERFVDRFKTASAEFQARNADPFFNINSPEDLANAQAQLSMSSV